MDRERRYKLPKELSEFKVLCPAARKPALLAALLAELAPQGPTIVFTASVAMAHRCVAGCLACTLQMRRYPLYQESLRVGAA